MTHLELENLASDYLEGLLEPARKAEIEAHLAGCAACRELIAEVRETVRLCRAAEKLEPAPWLVSKIFLATVGERQPTFLEQAFGLLRPVFQPRFAYAVAMAVFSFSIIINAAGINLRNLTLADLNPRTWVFRANLARHRLVARAEKFYYDLRVVIEIESRFRQLQSQPQTFERESPKPESQPGGTTHTMHPGQPPLASSSSLTLAASEVGELVTSVGNRSERSAAGRSQTQ
jgi:hypothetical protein